MTWAKLKFLHFYDQTVFSDPETNTYGDCTAACLKTYLQDPLKGFPHPIAANGGWNVHFWEALEAQFGLLMRRQPTRPDKDISFLPQTLMAAGPTFRTRPDGKNTHMVIWDRINWCCQHDPHPSRAGILRADMLYWLEPA